MFLGDTVQMNGEVTCVRVLQLEAKLIACKRKLFNDAFQLQNVYISSCKLEICLQIIHTCLDRNCRGLFQKTYRGFLAGTDRET